MTIDAIFRMRDKHFALDLAKAIDIYHSTTKGDQFESQCRGAVEEVLPPGLFAGRGLLAATVPERKQIDLVVLPDALPAIFRAGDATMLQPEWMLAAGEVKLGFKDVKGVIETAARVDRFIASLAIDRLPFLLLHGITDSSVGRERNARVVADIVDACPHLWPAAFVFDKDPNNGFACVAVDENSPIVAWDNEAGRLDGIMTIHDKHMSPLMMLYLYLWAGLTSRTPLPTMNYGFMSETLTKVTERDPLRVSLTTAGRSAERSVSLHLAATQVSPKRAAQAVSSPLQIPDISGDLTSRRRVMLVTLGPWVDEYASWDESPWGGGIEERDGHGYVDGMSEHALLQAARVFWKFNPDSQNWTGVDHAVVVHRGITRAVLRIHEWIGPFWDRHGFRASVEHDKSLNDELVGKTLRSRQNPIRLWRGLD